MENLGAMADSRYTGFPEITDRDVLELHCIFYSIIKPLQNLVVPHGVHDVTWVC